MGQLEAYGINEMYLSGMMIGLCGTYVSEAHESDSFESFKAYIYSATVLISRKLKSMYLSPVIVCNNEGGQYRSWSRFNLVLNSTLEITKVIDNFVYWQDHALLDFKIDEHVLKLQQRYNWQ